MCEGIPDALTAAAAGLRSVAVLGSQAPDHSVATRIAAHVDQHDAGVIAVIDNDDAGRTWGSRLTALLAEQNVDLAVIEPPGTVNDLNLWASIDPNWARCLDRSTLTPARAEHTRIIDFG